MRYSTPLRYPGGKGKLAPYIKALFEANHLLDGHYAEPYAGGAAVGLSLLYEEYASRVHINDLDRAVYAFWHSVLVDPEALCQLIWDRPVSMAEWRRQKAVYDHKAVAPLLDLGFATFFLNRTNRSGIITGGVIGGQAQEGTWSLDARYNKAELVQRIEKAARYASRISLYNLDAADFLVSVAAQLPSKSLTYLDPPYYVKGQQRLYASYYREEDHAHIARLAAHLPHRWVVSYDAAPEIEALYRRFRSIRYRLSYSAADRYRGEEVMFFADSVQLPERSPRAKAVKTGGREARHRQHAHAK